MTTRSMLRTVSMAIGALMVILMGASMARADDGVRVKVPFAFVVGETHLPAGSYTISRSEQTNRLTIANVDGRHAASALPLWSGAANREDLPKLEFEKQMGDYVLTHVVLDATEHGIATAASFDARVD